MKTFKIFLLTFIFLNSFININAQTIIYGTLRVNKNKIKPKNEGSFYKPQKITTYSSPPVEYSGNGSTIINTIVYTYDSVGNILNELFEEWKGKICYGKSRNVFTYDNKGNIKKEFRQYWERNKWYNSSPTINTFDDKGNLITKTNNASITTYTYDDRGNNLTDSTKQLQVDGTWDKVTRTFDDYNNQLTYLQENWQNNSKIFEIYRKHIFTYDNKGNILIDIKQIYQNNEWINESRNSFTYDANSNVLTELLEYWRNNEWNKNCRITYTYDAEGNEISDLYENLFIPKQPDPDMKNYRTTYTYDNRGNITKYLHEENQNDNWIPMKKTSCTYDENDNCINITTLIWKNNKWEIGLFEYNSLVMYYNNMKNYYNGDGYKVETIYKKFN